MSVNDEMNIRIKVLKGNADIVIKGMSKGMKSMASAMKLATKAAGPLGIAIGGVGLTLALKSAIKEASNFEKELAKVATLTKDTDVVFGKYADTVEDLSVKYGQSSQTLSKGLFDIVSAGIGAAEAMDVLTASTELAVGGVTTAGVATSAMITTFQIFENQLKDATDAADLLFAIQKKGRLTVEDVARTFGGIASTAAAANLSVEALGTAFAAISRGGEGAETSIVELRMVLEAFTKQAMPEAQAMARKFGFELDASTIEGDGLLAVVEKLRNSSVQQRAVIFRESRARRGLNNLLAQANNLTDIYEGIVNRAGENQEALNKQLETANVQFDRALQAMNKIKRILGEAMIDDMESLAKSTADWMGSIDGTRTMENFSVTMGILGAVIKFTAESTATLLGVFNDMVDATTDINVSDDVPDFFKALMGGSVSSDELEKQNQAIIDRTKVFEGLANAKEPEGIDIEGNRKAFRSRRRNVNNPELFKEDIDIMREAASDGFRAMNEEALDFAGNTDTRLEAMADTAVETFNIMDETVKTLAQSMQRSMGDFFFKALKRDFDNMGDFFNGFLDQILRGLSQVASQQLISGIAAGGKQGAFGGFLQSIFTRNKNAKGDIATEATPGIFAESGPEGILPLKRGSDGKLGVISSGGGGKSEDAQITIINTIAPASMVRAGLADPQVRNIIVNDISGDIMKRGTIFKTMRNNL